MSFTTTTPYMSLILPTPSLEPGPDWASDLNTALTLVDSHTHQTGSGQPITTAAISINADLTFGSFNATALRSSRFTSQVSALALPADINCIYSVNGDLYYNNAAGQQIQLTAGAALNAASIGAIGGDYATSTASLFYTSASSKFTFWSNTNTAAISDMGPLTIRTTSSGSAGVTIQPNASIGSSYNFTLPAALPGSTSFLTINTSGQVAAISTTQGITQSMLAPRTVAASAPAGGVAVSTATGVVQSIGNSRSGNVATVFLTTTGRPVVVTLIGATPNAYLGVTDSTFTAAAVFYLNNGSGDIAFSQLATTTAGTSAVETRVPPGSLYAIDFPAAGTYGYALAMAGTNVTTTVTVSNVKLVAFEI